MNNEQTLNKLLTRLQTSTPRPQDPDALTDSIMHRLPPRELKRHGGWNTWTSALHIVSIAASLLLLINLSIDLKGQPKPSDTTIAAYQQEIIRQQRGKNPADRIFPKNTYQLIKEKSHEQETH